MSLLDIRIDLEPDTPAVFVDSAQVSCAISNILCNGLEAYASGPADKNIQEQEGLMVIEVGTDKASRAVSIQVVDSGRGMDDPASLFNFAGLVILLNFF